MPRILKLRIRERHRGGIAIHDLNIRALQPGAQQLGEVLIGFNCGQARQCRCLHMRVPEFKGRSHRHLIDVIVDQLKAVQTVPLQLPTLADPRAQRLAELLNADPGNRQSLARVCRTVGAQKGRCNTHPSTAGLYATQRSPENRDSNRTPPPPTESRGTLCAIPLIWPTSLPTS